MRESEFFTSYPVAGPDAPHGPRSRLVRRGVAAEPVVDGAILEHAFDLGDGRALVLFTDDSPYEETLRVHLLDPDNRPIESLDLGSSYATGTLKNLRVVGARALELEFVHRKRCRITVNEAPVWRKPSWLVPGLAYHGSNPLRGCLRFELLDES